MSGFDTSHWRLLLSSKYHDATIVVGENFYQVHHAIIAQEAPVLKELLQSAMQKNPLDLVDDGDVVVEAIIVFIYSKQYNSNTLKFEYLNRKNNDGRLIDEYTNPRPKFRYCMAFTHLQVYITALKCDMPNLQAFAVARFRESGDFAGTRGKESFVKLICDNWAYIDIIGGSAMMLAIVEMAGDRLHELMACLRFREFCAKNSGLAFALLDFTIKQANLAYSTGLYDINPIG